MLHRQPSYRVGDDVQVFLNAAGVVPGKVVRCWSWTDQYRCSWPGYDVDIGGHVIHCTENSLSRPTTGGTATPPAPGGS